ncbi:asparagine synthase (glutamine-hydrolyzing) [Bradyrhizobium sp. OK095]|uniref:asparagine synthase (glutamine-hydrolyzing) n=1 Tax=Bradyrhizobium sp. OK095 TaxID=1882760 RepID=UPI0008C64C40|nr:asparagine synthase (glutamine-hydrolyzing) [Bradyrhizobium sp. OK095]SEN76949.1 asparagine synthase (glutamine-hydrolysing) [Bradyrhizobium sp. OK095]
MCGLIVARGGGREVLEELSRRGLGAIAHRGPDGDGVYVSEEEAPTILGHCRLSILDLTAAAAQPMVCPETGNVIVFNGEIYNFLELREMLEARGERFRGDGDTEVILAGWRVWGRDFFTRCNGMWAVAILERKSGDLILCRDRLGVKPLYIHRSQDRLILASEIRAIAAMRGGYPAPNPNAIFDFLTLGFAEHTSQTFFQGIEAVAPGQVWRIARDGTTTTWPYHRWPDLGEAQALEAQDVRGLLRDSTALRLRSDVPTVALLSGGLDSSILTGIGVSVGRAPRVTFSGAFTYGYADEGLAHFDETAQAAELMCELGSSDRHHIRKAQAVPDEQELRDLVATQEEPFNTPSILASFRTYRAVREAGYKVVISGEGSDETFGGYVKRYQGFAARDALRAGRLPTAFGLVSRGAASASLVLNRLAWDLPLPVLANSLRRHRPSVGMMSDALWTESRTRLASLQQDMRSNLQERLRRDVLVTNLPHILRITDRNAMRFGVEVRSPFLDYRLVERALATPAADRMGNLHGKAMLRQAFAGDLPDRVLWQRKTTGFGHAEQFLIPRMPLRRLLDDLPAELNDYLDIGRLCREASSDNLHTTFWLALSVALWYGSIYG